MVGSTYSWSLTNVKGVEGNEHPLGFPLNQYFPFFLLSFLAILNAVLCSRIPSHINQRQRLQEEINDDETKSRNHVTNLTVRYFLPNGNKEKEITYSS